MGRIEEIARRDNEHHVGGIQVLVRDTETEDYYLVSYITSAFDTHKPETLVFHSDREWNVTNWTDVAGGMNKSIEQAVEDLETVLNGRIRGIEETPMMENAGGDPFSALLNTVSAMAGRFGGGDYDYDDDDWDYADPNLN